MANGMGDTGTIKIVVPSRETVRYDLPAGVMREYTAVSDAGLWSGRFRYADETLYLYQRDGGNLYYRVGKGRRLSTGTQQISQALQFGIERLVASARNGTSPNGNGTEPPPPGSEMTLAEAFRYLRTNPHILRGTEATRQNYRTDLDAFAAVWAHRLNDAVGVLGKRDAESFIERRQTETIERVGARSLGPVSRDTAIKQLRRLRTQFNYLTEERHPSNPDARLLARNPLTEIDLPQENHRKREAASPVRYPLLMAQMDGVEQRATAWLQERQRPSREQSVATFHVREWPAGIGRAFLATAFHSGARLSSITHLQVADLLWTVRDVRATIRDLRPHRKQDKPEPSWADEWKRPAIRWRREHDKKDLDRVVPMSVQLEAELRRWLKQRKKQGITSDWLFPSIQAHSSDAPIRGVDVRLLIEQAVRDARAAAVERGEDPDQHLPHLDAEVAAWRTTWATMRDQLGWHLHRAARYAGGWTPRSIDVMSDRYVRCTAGSVLAVVDGKTYAEYSATAPEAVDVAAIIQAAM